MSRIEDFGIGFRILGIEPTTNFTEITKAYKKLSLKIHPDKCGEFPQKECSFIFKIVTHFFNLFEENKSYLDDIVREVRTIPESEIIRLTKTYLESERRGFDINDASYIFTLPILKSLTSITSPRRTSPPRPTPGPATGRREEERAREEELRRRAMEEEERAREEAIRRARREAEEERARRRTTRPSGTTRSPPRPATGKREEEELRRKAMEAEEKAREEAVLRARREAEEERARRRTTRPSARSPPRGSPRNERRYAEKLEELERLVVEIRNEIDKFYSRETDLLDIKTKVGMVDNIFEIGSKITNLNELLSNYGELGLKIENPIVQRARDISISSQGIVTERLNELENDLRKLQHLHFLYEPINLSIETNINEFGRLTIDQKLFYLNKIEERIEEKIREFQRGALSKGYETIPLYNLMLEDLVSKLRQYQQIRSDFIRSHH